MTADWMDMGGGMRMEDGWTGLFTRQDVLGAWKAGTRVAKVNGEPGDATANGTPGVVLGSIAHPDVHGGEVFYFIEWADAPKVAVGCMARKLRVVDV